MTIFIPVQLKKHDINYCLVEKKAKKPFQEAWQKKELKHDNQELLNHLSDGGNYGVIGGGTNHLIIIDFDNEQLQKEIIPRLPRTFTVKSGRGLLHMYFFSDKSESFKLFDENINTLADIQGEGKQVIGANSIHPNGNVYQVVDESDIAFINYSELRAILMPYNKKPEKEKKPVIKPERNYTGNDNDFIEVIKSRVSITDVLSLLGVDITKNPTNCPLHASAGGKCLGFNNETWHCFHCEDSGNMFTMPMKVNNLEFKDVLLWFADNFNLKKEYDDCKKQYLAKLQKEKEQYFSSTLEKYAGMMTAPNKDWGQISELLVSVVKKEFKIFTTRDDLKSEVWVYSNGIYVPQGRSQIREFLRRFMGDKYNQFIYGKVMEKIEPDTFIDADEFFRSSLRYEIPVINGILNVKTGELSEFNPNKIFFHKIPVTFDKNAKCELIDKFLKEILASEEDVKVFYELAGFCLEKDYSFEKAFMFVGNGRNGKSKIIELLKRFVGSYNVCSVPLSAMNSDNFSLSELFGKLINLAGDISNTDLKETGVFKQLTGRDIIGAKRKFMRDIHFVNYAKFVFACNELPMVYDFSRGFWDRWILLDFPYTFVKQDEYDAAENKVNLKIRDVNIIDRITSDVEMSGLLNMALLSLNRLKDNNGFSYALGCETVKGQWIRRSNSFTAFCYDYLDSDGLSSITKKDLRRAYSDYCRRFNVVSKSDYVIKRVLQDLFGVIDEKQGLGNDYEMVWAGVKWKDDKRIEVTGRLV